MNNDIEIVGISTIGTYPSWIEYTIASFYNHVDKVIVVNGGYNIFQPEDGAIHRLEKEHKILQQIDIHNKILEYTPNQDNVEQIFKTTCKKNKDEFGRSTNMTLSTQIAHKLPNPENKQRWLLKLDSDQILYRITREQLEHLITEHSNKTGFRFAQYSDYIHDFQHIGTLPDEFTNDGSLLYKSIPNQGYSGQGSPGYIRVDQQQIYSIKTSHMRRISPQDVEKYEYFLKRYWYHTFAPDSIMETEYNRKTGKHLTPEQILETAHKNTISTIKQKGNHIDDLLYDERIPYRPPLVCKTGPLEYIKKGY